MRYSTIAAAALFVASSVATPVKYHYVYKTVYQYVQATPTVANAQPAEATPCETTPAVVQQSVQQAPPPEYVYQYQPAPQQQQQQQEAPVQPQQQQPQQQEAPVHQQQQQQQSQPSDSGSYQQIVLYHHNAHRRNHSVPDLTWSAELANIAQQIGQTCVYAHNRNIGGGNYGQNIAAGAANVGEVITSLFYNGECSLYGGQYGASQPDMSRFEKWGHFTQVVWKATTEVGCATVDCSGRGLANAGGNVPPIFTVCNYRGAGNVQGQYASNVLRPLGHPSIKA